MRCFAQHASEVKDQRRKMGRTVAVHGRLLSSPALSLGGRVPEKRAFGQSVRQASGCWHWVLDVDRLPKGAPQQIFFSGESTEGPTSRVRSLRHFTPPVQGQLQLVLERCSAFMEVSSQG